MAKAARSKKVIRRDRASRALRKHADRRDGFYNEFSGHGTARDRRTATNHNAAVVTEQSAMSMWRGDDIMARIIEKMPQEAVRRGITLKVADKGKKKGSGKELAEQVMSELERLNLLEKMKCAGQFERAYGGAAIFPVLTGAVGELDEDLANYKSNILKVEALHVLEARELRPASWYTDITHPKFRQPETYRLWPLAGASGTQIDSEIIHESRLIIFPGIRVSNQMQPGQRPGWGDSIVTRCIEVVADYGLAWGSAATLLHEFATGVVRMDQLTELLASKGGKRVVADKLELIEMVKSTINARVIDKNDEYSRQSTPVSGLEGLLVQLAQRLAAAADMPVTILMGMSPAGLNATGESDIRGWYDRVSALQAIWTSIVEWIVGLVMLQNDGPTGGIEPDTWSIEWVPLWQPSEKEVAETRKIVADTDKVYYDMGGVKAATIARSRWGGDTYSADMHFEAGELDAMVAQDNLANTNPEDMSDEDLATLGVDVEAYRAAQEAKAAAAAGADPNAPAGAPPPEDVELPDAGELLEIVEAVVDGKIARESAIVLLGISYKLDPATAEQLLGPEDFEPVNNTPPQLQGFGPPDAPSDEDKPVDGAPPKDEPPKGGPPKDEPPETDKEEVAKERRPFARKDGAIAAVRNDGDWNEEDHPRADDGKFGEGGGGSKTSKGTKKGSKLTPELEKAARDRASRIGIKDPTPKELQHFANKVMAEGGPKAEIKPAVAANAPKTETVADAPNEPTFEELIKEHGFDRATQMIQNAEAKANARQNAAIEKHGGDPKLAAKLIDGWIADAYTEQGFAIKAAVAKSIGKPVDKALERSYREVSREDPKAAEKLKASAQKFVKSAKNVDTVEAIMKASQDAHEGETVTLYRGIGGKQAQAIRESAKSGGKVKIDADVTTSFSEDPKVAELHAAGGGVMVTVQVPRSSIVLSHRIVGSNAQRGEKEVVVASKDGFSVDAKDIK